MDEIKKEAANLAAFLNVGASYDSLITEHAKHGQ